MNLGAQLVHLKVGGKIWFEGERMGYTVQARNSRYLVCNKPFNLKHTVLYCIVDLVEWIRGPEGLVFGAGAETRQDCEEILARVTVGETDISRRRMAPLRVWKTDHVS